jgi:predicted site-specific integrase-resolvase
MQHLNLREAAQQSGTNLSTILRAIQSGRLKAERNAENQWTIEPFELMRIYLPAS